MARLSSKTHSTEILLHRIEYWYRDLFKGPLNGADENHIKQAIVEGCREGELATSDPKNQNITHYGWWAIVF